MENYILIFILLNFLLFFLLGKISYKLNLVDFPSKRKIHLKPTSYSGGIILSIIFLLSIRLFDVVGKDLNLILSVAFLISIVGLIDDKFQLNTGGKLSLQIIPIFYLIIFGKLDLTHIGDYKFFLLDLGTLAVPFTLLSVLFLINAFNYFDGLDGTLSLTSISVLGILYFLVSDENIKLFLLTLFIPIIIFLFFNFSLFGFPKLFLGDSGSLLLGFIIAFILIYLAKQKIAHPIVLAWSIAIFVYEFLSINLIRIKNKVNPFTPGQDHLHHILLFKINSLFLTNSLISIINIIFFIMGYLSYKLINPLTSLTLYIVTFLIYYVLRERFSVKIKLNNN